MEIGFYKKPEYIKYLVKKLRKNMTLAEKLLREKVRNKQIEWLKFHRQKALFVYRENEHYDRFLIADFYCHSQKLIIEADGAIHQKKQVKDYDALREYLLKEAGYKIIRFTNEEIISDIENLIHTLKNSLSL